MHANTYFIEFAYKFYLLLTQNYSMSQAVREAEKAAEIALSNATGIKGLFRAIYM